MLSDGPNTVASKSGVPTLVCNGVFLHSRFSPMVEAEKFVAGHRIKNGQTILLLFPGLSYIYDVLKNQYPDSKLIVIQNHPSLMNFWNILPKYVWTPGMTTNIESFLYSVIQENELSLLTIVTFRPVRDAFMNISEYIEGKVKTFAAGISANIRTKFHFGKRWLTNIVLNLLAFDATVSVPTCNTFSIVASSGPSMNEIMPSLIRHRGRYVLVALPSSIRGLVHNGLYPHMVTTSDAGFYAGKHLEFLNRSEGNRTIVAAALRGMLRPLWHSMLPVMFWRIQIPLEAELCSLALQNSAHTDHVFPYMEDRGTIAASTIDITARFFNAKILIAGLDLANKQQMMHVTPHTFDEYYTVREKRTFPRGSMVAEQYYSESTRRISEAWWYDRTQSIYREWFLSQAASFPSRISLLSHEASTGGFVSQVKVPEIDSLLADLPVSISSPVQWDVVPFVSIKKRKDLMYDFLQNKVKSIFYVDTFTRDNQELAAMLAPQQFKAWVDARIEDGRSEEMSLIALRKEVCDQLLRLADTVCTWNRE